MNCACIEGHFDYHILPSTCVEIKFQDKSLWVEKPEKYTIGVTPPGYSQEYSVSVYTNTVNFITPQALFNNSKTSFNDGVYCVTTSDCCNVTYKRRFLKSCTIDCKITNILAEELTKCKEEQDEDKIECAQNSKMLVEGAKYAMLCGDYTKVQELIKLANEALDKYSCKCPCTTK